MRRQAIMTPPATAMPQRMITPNVNATYIHDERLPANCVPNFDMRFETEDDAFEFYRKKVSLSRRTRTDHV